MLGPRSGLKDEFNALIPLREPGYLAEALGGRVEQYYALEKDVPASGTWGAGEISVWAEQMKTTATDGRSIAAVWEEQRMVGWATVRDHSTGGEGADYVCWWSAGCKTNDGSGRVDDENECSERPRWVRCRMGLK